jgi:hypothetical protein
MVTATARQQSPCELIGVGSTVTATARQQSPCELCLSTVTDVINSAVSVTKPSGVPKA